MDSEHERLTTSISEQQGDGASYETSQATFSHECGDTSQTEGKNKCWSLQKRYIVALLAFLGFANIYSMRVNLSVAIVSMTSNKTRIYNGSLLVYPPDYPWSTELQGQVLASFFYGYILSQLPGGFLANRYGGKYFFGGGVFLTSILTLLTPLFTTWSVFLLIGARVFEGLFEGVTYPSIHAIWAKWAPPQEKTKLATFAFAGSYFGTVVSLPLSGALADSQSGWQAIFYVLGSLAVVWFLVWMVVVTESPAMHPTISNTELEHIQQSIGYTDEQTKRIHPPWLSMLASGPVWAITAAHFAENWGFYTWLTGLPTFMEHILGVTLTQGGFYSALPYLVMCIVVLSGGMLADMLRAKFMVPTGVVRKLFTCGAFAIQSIFMVAAGYLMTKTAAISCLTIAVGIGGFAWAGFSVNHLDIAPQFASILMGLSNTFATLPGIVSPAFTGAVVTSLDNAGQWQIIFYVAAGIYIMGAVVYGIFSSGDRQKWAEVPLGYQPYLDDPEKDH